MKIKRKLSIYGCIVLAGILIIAAAMCFNSFQPSKPEENSYQVAGDGTGDGTENNPYLIGSAGVFNSSSMRANFGVANKHFKLIDDIDLQGITWIPITSFAAGNVFDGNGKEINNLRINISNYSGEGAGLFATVNGGTFKNLTLNNIDITGGYNTGSIGGSVTGTVTCTNVYIKGGTIMNSGLRTGGFFGLLRGQINLTIDKCYAESVNITNTGNSTGGLIGLYEYPSGSNNMITITNSYHIGDISTKNNIVGGIMGGTSSSNSLTITIKNCFHIGKVETTAIISGGIIGYLSNTAATVYIDNCYSSASISANSNTGGIYGGYSSGTPTMNINNCYYDSTLFTGNIHGATSNEETKITISGGSSGKSTAEMKTAVFAALLGDAYIHNDGGFPTLRAFLNTVDINVTFNQNYSGAPAEVVVSKIPGSEITDADIQEPTRIGYTFAGWNTQADGNGTNYTYNAGVLIGNIDAIADQTLYAQWQAIIYNLSVDFTGDGSVTPFSSSTVTLENSNVYATATPNQGGNFAYWQVRNKENTGWVPLNNYLNHVLNIQDILDENFILTFAQTGTNNIDFQAVFADTYTVTVRSDYQYFGTVTLNGGLIDYNTPAKIVQGSDVTLAATAIDHYEFDGFDYKINSIDKTDPTFTVTEDVIVYVTFKMKEYTITSSSKYSTGEATLDSNLISLSNTNVKIGDEIQVSYETNKAGYRFLSLNLVKQDGTYYNLNADGFGSHHLEITKDILDNYLMFNAEIVALYIEQYGFSVNFENEKIDKYCVIEVYTESVTGKDYLNLGTVYYLDNNTRIVINISFDPSGYKNLSAYDSISATPLILVNGDDYAFNLDSEMLISIGLEALTFNVKLDAVNHEGDSILEINFNTEKEFSIEYNSQIDPIEKNDIKGYRFVGWKIFNYDPQVNSFEILDAAVIGPDNNLLAINFSFLNGKYISPEGDIRIIAEYHQVFTLVAKIDSLVSHTIFVGGELMTATSGQFDFGEEVKIEVKESEYIKFLGFVLNGEVKNVQPANGKYVLTFNLEEESTVTLKFESINQTITKKLNKANGTMEYETAKGKIDGDTITANINDTVTLTFNTGSGYILKEWKINNLTIEDMQNAGYVSSYNGNILVLDLNEKTLNWLRKNEMKLDINVTTIFNPLFTSAIIIGGILIIGLLAFIAIYMNASSKKKKAIEAAVQAGIIGSARFKSNIVEDALNAKATEIEADENPEEQ